MRTYKKELLEALNQNNIKKGLLEIKPIPDQNKTEGMDPRMLKTALEKAKRLQREFFVEKYQLYEERNRTDRINYDLTTTEIIKKQRLLKVKDHYINSFFYIPKVEGKLPVIVYVHGGAFITGDHKQYENQCKYLAQEAEAVVIFPEYRLAPENPFPAGIYDVNGVIDWLLETKENIDIDTNKIVLVGDSAGASVINGTVLIKKRDQIKLLFEIYPCCDIDIIGNGVYEWSERFYNILPQEEYAVKSRMNRMRGMIEAMKELYLLEEDGKNPLISAVYQEDFSRFPPTVIVTGEYDFLRVSADIFAKKCMEAGKLKRAIRYQGCDHGFFDMLGIMPQAEDIILEIAKEIHRL